MSVSLEAKTVPTFILSRPDRIGDVTTATACLESIRRQRPDARVVFLAREIMRPLLEDHPLLDGFIPLPAPGGGMKEFRAQWRALAEQMRARHADALVHLHPNPLAQLAGRSAGVPQRIGYPHSWLLDALTLTASVPDRRRAGYKHEAEYTFDLLAPLGIAPPPSADGLRASVYLADRWRDSLHAKLAALGWAQPLSAAKSGVVTVAGEGYTVLNPTAHSTWLRWPAAYFAQLAREAAGRLGRIVLVSGSADDPSILEIRRLLGNDLPGLTDLSGAINLAELGWLLRGARVYISRTTGTAHLAAAVGCPVVELFGRLEPIYGPVRWRALGPKTASITVRPYARRWNETKRAYWKRGYHSIPVEEVLAAALRLTSGTPADA